MKNELKHLIRHILWRMHRRTQLAFYKKIKKINNIHSKKSADKISWRQKWSGLGIKPDDIYFDVFSEYMTDAVNIIPENICHDIIERILNPVIYDGYYGDKNNFDLIFPKGFLPRTILRKKQGSYLDENYRFVDIDRNNLLHFLNKCHCDRLVLKPTVESCSGNGVNILEKRDGIWIVLGENQTFSYDYLESEYGSDFIIQEAIDQLPYISQFNPTSVNTLRLTVYRSVANNECVVPSAVIRIGGKGALKDNAHQGGGFLRLNLDGSLGDKVLNQWGHKTDVFNGIDFAHEKFVIPNFASILEFAKQIGECVHSHRLIALDIAVDKNGRPILIEFNSGVKGAYGMWVFQYAGDAAFGQYTDEIIEYCRKHLNEARQNIIV